MFSDLDGIADTGCGIFYDPLSPEIAVRFIGKNRSAFCDFIEHGIVPQAETEPDSHRLNVSFFENELVLSFSRMQFPDAAADDIADDVTP